MPLMQAPTTTTEATPMMMPIKVRKDRSLWARIDETAIRRASMTEVESMSRAGLYREIDAAATPPVP
jgi:hypothetical protein